MIVSEYGIDAYDADASPDSNLYRNVSDIDLAGSSGRIEARGGQSHWNGKQVQPVMKSKSASALTEPCG